MSLLSRITKAGTTAAGTLFGPTTSAYSARIALPSRTDEAYAERYVALKAYRNNNRLYDELRQTLTTQGFPDRVIAGLRNPTNAVVDFYAATIAPGGNLRDSLPVEVPDDNERREAFTDAVYQLMAWSNWGTRKQPFVRDLATLGDQFIRIGTRQDDVGTVRRVYWQVIPPECVREFAVDERNFLEYIRLDVPRFEYQPDGERRHFVRIQVWDKRLDTYRSWEVDPKQYRSAGDSLDKLGPPDDEADIEDRFGHDFLPFVHFKFIDDGEERGMAAIEPALDKIDEVNAMATRLHQKMFRFNQPDEQLIGSATDPDGLPMPPPAIDGDEAGIVEYSGVSLLKIPSGWKLEPRNRQVNYQAELDAITAMMDHLRETDLPELEWARISSSQAQSGIALRLRLTAPLAKAEEVRGNIEAGLIRAAQMGLTIAQLNDLDGFGEADIGRFDRGEFEFWFADRSVVPLAEDEAAQVEKTRSEAYAIRVRDLGWSVPGAQRDLGVDEETISEMRNEASPAGLASDLLRTRLDERQRAGEGQ